MVGMLYPLGLFVAALISPNLDIGWLNFFILLIGSGMFPVFGVLAFRANRDIDAGLFTIINNITPIVTIIVASILLHEHLGHSQAIGAAVIISSAFIATLPKLHHHVKANSLGILFAISSVAILGVAIVFEKWMLGRMDFGAYLVFGWGAQTLWMAIMAWPERKHIRQLFNHANRLPVIGYAATNALKGLCFVGSLKLSANASLISSVSSFLAVMVVIAAYFTLGEKEHLGLKITSAIIGMFGLVIIYQS